MSEPQTPPEPTEQDRENEHRRRLIAERQNNEFAEVSRMALGALGPGFTPWMVLRLIDHDHRQTGNTEPVAIVYKVYRGEDRLTENSLFIRRMPDGKVMKATSYELLFGDLLHEKHPTRTVEIRGEQVPVGRYELVWGALEEYHPKTAEQLSALRVSREAGKERRADAAFVEKNPLLAHAGIKRQDIEPEEGRGR
jgi:hypothetical protein